ncbi:MAG TPA: MarR family transcriptional regulator [Chloroflexota bacterium]|nr:MarR family transcriptional regulator [Chloroflexota bacterium]
MPEIIPTRIIWSSGSMLGVRRSRLDDPIARQTPLRVPSAFAEVFPDGSASGTELVLNVLRTAQLLLARVTAAIQPFGLSPAGFSLLDVLANAGEPLSPRVISQRLLVAPQTLTSLLDSLERRGLIRRTPHPRDRRAILVVATEAGSALLHAACTPVVAGEMEWTRSLRESERQTLIALLGRLQASLYAESEAP